MLPCGCWINSKSQSQFLGPFSTAACYISLLTWRGNIAWGGNPLSASVDQKWSCRGQIWPFWTRFFAYGPCQHGFGESLFFGAPIFTFLGVKKTFFWRLGQISRNGAVQPNFWKSHSANMKPDCRKYLQAIIVAVQSVNDGGWLCFRAMSLKGTCWQRRRTWWRARRSWTRRVEKVILIWWGRCDDGGRRQERKWEFF